MKSRRFAVTEPLVVSDLTRVLSAEGRRAFAVFHDPVTFRGLSTRHEVHRTITNQVSSTNFFEGLAQGRPIVRIVVTPQRRWTVAQSLRPAYAPRPPPHPPLLTENRRSRSSDPHPWPRYAPFVKVVIKKSIWMNQQVYQIGPIAKMLRQRSVITIEQLPFLVAFPARPL